MPHPFQTFLEQFVPKVEQKATQLNKALWILETTGLADAADLKAELDKEMRLLFNDPAVYRDLVAWDQRGDLSDPILKRQLNVLIRTFKQNLVPEKLLAQLAEKEAALSQSYALFRARLDGKEVSENDLRNLAKQEQDVEKRKRAWEASKEIGQVLAPQILELVSLRNEAARSLGYSDYFQMQLELQEVDANWLLKTMDDLSSRSEKAYEEVLGEIEQSLSQRFGVAIGALGPWSWADPFGQEDPLDGHELDQLVQGTDIAAASASFYDQMGIDVKPILGRSDMYERPGKSQHAFCIHIDRRGDVRTLNNVNPSLKWLETVLHELGHAIYEVGFDPGLPWLLREPPHMITTEAMALMAGRQAYRAEALKTLIGKGRGPLTEKVDRSLKRRQLIFSRWVMVMTAFESELYRNPPQDLNGLWWNCVEKYQKIRPPAHREGKWDWAAKYHIGLAPVYYFSYLLGEMFASAIQESLLKECRTTVLSTQEVGKFLNAKLFGPGNRMSWSDLIQHVTGSPLTPDAWIREFAM